MFDRTTKLYHLPAATAQGAEREKLLQQATVEYNQLLRRYPEESSWCARALRSLANVRAEQGRIDEAVKLYERVAEKYPNEAWEVLQAWKSAADLLWEAGRLSKARIFYQKVVDRFDTAEAPAIVQTVVRGSRARLTP